MMRQLLSVGEDATDEQLDGIVERLYAELDVDDAHYMRGLCLIMLVGEGMVNMVGTTARVAFNACSYTNQYRVV